MNEAIIITPVKDSIERTLSTIKAIHESDCKVRHIVYNDFSTPETKKILEESIPKYRFELIHLEDITSNPSPNYKIVLQDAQAKAIEANLPLIVVESDVTVKLDTFQKILNFTTEHVSSGLVGAITVDESGAINFPYLKFKDKKDSFIETKRSLSFCCTLMSMDFLKAFSFLNLDSSKDWYDTFISAKAIELGFKNFVLIDTSVLHQPHGSRPWKQLKYTNPLKYYFFKLIKGRDQI
ncbi:MAG: glycosyltransferase [Ginsengibacter sp.]